MRTARYAWGPPSPHAPRWTPPPQKAGRILAETAARTEHKLIEEVDRAVVVRMGEREPIPSELRFGIGLRDGWRCQWCWSSGSLHLDHVIPWSAGGQDTPTNLRLLCKPCNEYRSNYLTDSRPQMPLTLVCIRCDNVQPDSFTADAFCLVCGRVGPTRRDHRRLTARHYWQDLSWEDWKRRRYQAARSRRWPIELVNYPPVGRRLPA